MLADAARPGHANQALGTAEALGLPFAVKELRWGPLAKLPNALLGATLAGLDDFSTASLAPPWPQLVIGAGRRTAPAARWIGRRCGCRCVQLMWPGSATGLDLVIVPAHDGTAGRPKVAVVTAAPHRLTPERLADAAVRLRPRLADLPRPRLGCLVGGSRPGASFGPAQAQALAETASRLALAAGGSVLMLTSRRTGAEAEGVLSAGLAAPHRFHAFTGDDADLHAGIIGTADALLATADSASLLSEACAAGRPVRLFRAPGWRLGKLERLHATLAPWLRPVDSPLVAESLPRLDSAGEAARLIRPLLAFAGPHPYVPPRRSMA